MAPRAPADRFLFYAFLALLLWMPLPFGSNVAWASSLMEAWVFLIAGLWLVQYYRGRVSLTRPFVRAWPVTACLLATLLWIVVQGLPLPAGALGLLSPRALEIHNTTHSYPSLSLDVHATRQAALQTLAIPALLLPDIAARQQPAAHQVAGAGDHRGRRVPGRLWIAHDALRARARDLHRQAGPRGCHGHVHQPQSPGGLPGNVSRGRRRPDAGRALE